MSYQIDPAEKWNFLIGYPLHEAEEVLREEAAEYVVQFTAPPNKDCERPEALVIAVRVGDPAVLVCASPDWTVN